MRCAQLMGVMGIMLASTASWAGSDQARSQPAGQAAALPRTGQRLTRHQAEVKRLEKDVAKQESESQQASKRLQQQDQAIAELQKQLRELQAKSSSDHH
jgi:peptidoglycan hydrolase CwlO-like protein